MTRPAGLAPLLALDALEQIEKLLRTEPGPDPQRRVVEVRLVEDFPYRLRAPSRRFGFDDESLAAQALDRLAQVGRRVADVRSEAQPGLASLVRSVAAQRQLRLIVSSTDAPSITTGIGGSGLLPRTVTTPTDGKRSSRHSPMTAVSLSRVR